MACVEGVASEVDWAGRGRSRIARRWASYREVGHASMV